MLPIASPKFNQAAVNNVVECVETGWVSRKGKFVTQFEETFAKYLGVKYAISTSNGTAALHLALVSLGIGEGDEVLVPTFTYIATANAVVYTGAKPIFCKVNPDTLCIDIEDAAKRCTSKSKAVIPVHLNGYPVDMHSLLRLAIDEGLLIIEDACQALGSVYKGHKLGSVGNIGCFSFFANKQITTGEGGMCTTNSKILADRMRMLRDHGRTNGNAYSHETIGFNYHMTNLQAAIGLPQIREIEEENLIRKHQYLYMIKELEDLGHQPYNTEQSPWLYCCHLPSATAQKNALMRLTMRDIESKPYFIHCHNQRPYRNGSTGPMNPLYGVFLPIHKDVTMEHIKTIKEVLVGCI